MFSFFKKKSSDTPETPAPGGSAPAPAPEIAEKPAATSGTKSWLRNPFASKDTSQPADNLTPSSDNSGQLPIVQEPQAKPEAPTAAGDRKGWMDRLKAGLRKTGSSISTIFTGTKIDDALYEELEDALLMADTGVKATQHLLADLKQRVKDT